MSRLRVVLMGCLFLAELSFPRLSVGEEAEVGAATAPGADEAGGEELAEGASDADVASNDADGARDRGESASSTPRAAVGGGGAPAVVEPAPSRRARSRRLGWLADAALAAVWVGLIPMAVQEPRLESAFGPVYRGPEDAEALALEAERGTLGRRHLDEETVSDGDLLLGAGLATLGGVALGLAIAPLFDGERQGWRWVGEQALSFAVGAVQTWAGVLVLGEVVKNWVGRLRPDFADRVDRYVCYQDPVPVQHEARCAMLEARGELGPPVDEAVIRRGRRSFWSGHAALSMAAMTYASLYIGGRMVWGRSANLTTRLVGVLAQGALMTSAVFIGASRLSDGVHHPEDVLAGAVAGFALANLGYWMRFDRRGEVRDFASLQVSAAPATGGGVATIGGRF